MNNNSNIDEVVVVKQGLTGVFPTLLDPARALAAVLPAAECRELTEHPGFWVGRLGQSPMGAIIVTPFEENGEQFVLFEQKMV